MNLWVAQVNSSSQTLPFLKWEDFIIKSSISILNRCRITGWASLDARTYSLRSTWTQDKPTQLCTTATIPTKRSYIKGITSLRDSMSRRTKWWLFWLMLRRTKSSGTFNRIYRPFPSSQKAWRPPLSYFSLSSSGKTGIPWR